MKDSCSDRDNGKARAKTERCGGFLFGVPSTPSIWCVLPQCMHTSARAVSTSTGRASEVIMHCSSELTPDSEQKVH